MCLCLVSWARTVAIFILRTIFLDTSLYQRIHMVPKKSWIMVDVRIASPILRNIE